MKKLFNRFVSSKANTHRNNARCDWCARCVISLFFLITPGANANTIDQITAPPTFNDVKISPDGEHLAVRIFLEGKHSLRFLDRDSLEVVGGYAFADNMEVGEFYWVNNERVVGEVLDTPEGRERPAFYGELFGVNMDGKRGDIIFGYRSGERQIGSKIKKRDPDYAWAEIIDVLPDDPRNILISSTPMSTERDRFSTATLLEVYRGTEKGNLAFPKYPSASFYTDDEGTIRLITSLKDDHTRHLQSLPEGAKDWIDMPDGSYSDEFRPVALTPDKQSAYILDALEGDRVGLYKLALDGSGEKKVYVHPEVDITEAVMTTDRRTVYAVRVDNGYPSYLMFKSDHPEAVAFKRLLQTFSGQTVSIRSVSDDGNYWIVMTTNDVSSGQFYLFDLKNDTARLLFDARPDVDASKLATVTPISFTSFDGQKVAGYFTKAMNSKDDSVAPLVVLVHGGPESRDYWEYNTTVQVLATHGFSVLQINFRGSTGYGSSFQNAWDQNREADAEADILSGTHWAIKEGLAEKTKICIMGSSFGGYSAVMSATIEPDLYQCVVANAGIYDLSLQYTEGDIETFRYGQAFLERTAGAGQKKLDIQTPLPKVSRLKAPVFLAYGKQDNRAGLAHVDAIKRALDESGKSYVPFFKSREGSGFYDRETRVAFLEAAIEFLNASLTRD